MKQFIIFFVTIALLGTLGTLEMSYLEKTKSYISSDITHIRNTMLNDDYNTAKNHIKQVEETWNNMKGIWNMIIDHNEIDKLETALESFKVYVSNEKKVEAFVQYELLMNNFNHILNSKTMKIENII